MVELDNARYTKRTMVGGLEALEIRHPLLDACVLLQGAQLIHFAPAGDDNWLWMSPQARFQKGKPVRGGIPVCWPWFGDPPRNPDPVRSLVQSDSAHGFARTALWRPVYLEELEEAVCLTLELDTTGVAYPWSGLAHAEITFRFSPEQVTLALTTGNTGTDLLAFTQALHTYLPVPSITETRIMGLDGARYIDTLDDWAAAEQAGDITFHGETDRIYQAAPAIRVQTPGKQYRLTSTGSGTTVVWNPGPEKSRRLSDFPDDGWTGMVCVETANAALDFRTLTPGERHTLTMTLAES